MKIFILYARENWIIDELVKEWIENNQQLYTNHLNDCDIIWILSDYIYHQIPIQYYKQKKVITTIHHITPWKVDDNIKRHFNILNEITDVFHTMCDKTKIEMDKYFSKPIKSITYWHNEGIWKCLNDKNNLRKKYNLSNNFLVGSFQRDTEGNSISNKTYQPKLEKGPDIFMNAVLLLKKDKYPNLKVLLTGYRRNYLIEELKKNNIEYYYFEMCDFNKLNELMNCLDLYIVASRVEGGPRAINECSLTKTPLLSTDVGVSDIFCYPNSIFDMNNIETILNCEIDIEYNYEKAEKYKIENYMRKFTEDLFSI